MTDGSGMPDDPVETLRRWTDSGGIWRVVRRSPAGPGTAGGELEILLLTCNAGEVMGRLVSADPALAAHVGDRDRSDD